MTAVEGGKKVVKGVMTALTIVEENSKMTVAADAYKVNLVEDTKTTGDAKQVPQ